MNVTPIKYPLGGEAALAVVPRLAREVSDANWRRRVNLFTGRALSDVALRLEQQERAGHLATLGQAFSYGVVAGLEPSFTLSSDVSGNPFHSLQISPGAGLAATGEDVMVTRPMTVDLRDVPVYSSGTAQGGDTLGALLSAAALPVVGVFVLEPIVGELMAGGDTSDPCERDPANDPFDDQQVVDGCRLSFVPWPEAWHALPAERDHWRNRIAYTIFDAEAHNGPDAALPWEEAGVPIALAAFGASAGEAAAIAPFAPLFLDRFSVVRAGGKPRRRSRLIPATGNPFLWQARIQQFAEQMAELGLQGTPVPEAAIAFRYLPPFGLLPKEAADPRGAATTSFFPSSYYIDAVPVPSEQLDAMLRASAGLAPFDMSTGDRVRLLVPVPQTLFEPRLLLHEQVDAAFQAALTEALARRADWLHRREDVRAKGTAIVKAIAGTAPEYPPLDQDPDALEGQEEIGTAALDPPEDAYQTGANTMAIPFETLAQDLRSSSPWTVLRSSTLLDVLGGHIDLPDALPAAFQTRLTYDEENRLLVLIGVTSIEERDALQAIEGADEGWRAAIAKLHDQSNTDFRELYDHGVQAFIDYLDGKIRRADDQIDFGFLHIHTHIYRVRQLMLGSLEATRLATSPVVAAIAKGETAVATRQDLTTFFEAARKTKVAVPAGGSKGALDFIKVIREGTPIVAPLERGPAPRARLATSANVSVGGLGGFTPKPIATIHATLAPPAVVLDRSGGAIAAAVISAAGIQLEKKATVVDAIQAHAVAGSAISKGLAVPTGSDITQAQPIIGETYDFRTSTIAQRLEQPPALEAKSFSVAGKYDVLSGLSRLDLHLADVPIAGMGNAAKMFADLTPSKLGDVLAGVHDPNPTNGDEADFLGAGIKALDDAVTTMRAVEGRIQQYRTAMSKAQQALGVLKDAAGQIDRRLKVIGDGLAEARHDASVTRALLAEENSRVRAINDRRDLVIAQHVRFLAYIRPRAIDPGEAMPTRVLTPGLMEATAPSFAGETTLAPPELRAMVDLLRESPVRWFRSIVPLLDKLDRLDTLHGAIAGAKLHANVKTVGAVANVIGFASGGLLANAMTKTFVAQQAKIANVRQQTAQLDLSAFVGQSWQHTRDQAPEILSIGDLIDGSHGQTVVASKASLELERITQAATALYLEFGAVVPRLRLFWAERFSQYDETVNLHNLSALPGWSEIEFLDRQQMQATADWLYQRVDPLQADAVALMNDIVRVALLLASHAPVDEIIAGDLAKPAAVKPGSTIDLNVDLGKVFVGMQALVYDAGQQVVARAVVHDLVNGLAAARVVEMFKPQVSLEAGARVHFTARKDLVLSKTAVKANAAKR